MPKKTLTQIERAEFLAQIPPDVARVGVITAKGERKFKAVEDIADDDTFQLTSQGKPVVMRSSPGRQPIPGVAPANNAVAQIMARKQRALAKDPLITALDKDDSSEAIRAAIIGLSEEAASLKFEREEAAREGKDTANISSRRVQALRATVETLLKQADMTSVRMVDLDSAPYAALFRYTMETIREAMIASRLREEQVEIIFNKFSQAVDHPDWKDEATRRMKKTLGG
jgi:hypothetical protein